MYDPFNQPLIETENAFKKKIFNSLEIQYKLWCNFLGLNELPSKTICSPFRIDRKPGCSFYIRNNAIFFIDGGAIMYPKSMNIIHAYMHVNKIDYSQAIHQIALDLKDINSNIDTGSIEIKKYDSSIIKKVNNFVFKLYYQPLDWTKKAEEIIGRGLFNANDLKREHCYLFNKYWKNSKSEPKTISGHRFDDLSYAYSYNRTTHKLRFFNVPKHFKWLSNVPPNYVGGFTDIDYTKPVLIVTKSLMDYLTIVSLGYNCRFLSSETVLPTEEFLEKCNNDFSKVIFLSDYDRRGRKRAIELNALFIEKKYKNLYATTIKDFKDKRITDTYDILKYKNINQIKYELNRIIDESFSQSKTRSQKSS